VARQVKGPPAGNDRKYTLKALGNRDGPPGDVVSVWIRTPNEREKREIQATGKGLQIAIGDDGMPEHNEAGQMIGVMKNSDDLVRVHLALERHVTKVENYNNSAGEPISDGADFAKYGDDEFVYELAAEILHGVSWTEEQRKKYKGSPAIGSEATRQQDGTVESAESLDSTKRETVQATATETSDTSPQAAI